nr:hypothetical protein [Tanacetum cinerariifolium]
MEHLMGKAYIDEDLTTMKPHQITEATFKDFKISEVPLTAHMREVAKLPKQHLTYLSEGINAEDAGDNLSSSKPKASESVKDLTPSQASKSQPVDETEVPADATTSLDASKSVEEQENQPQTIVPKKEQDKIVREDKHKADEQHDDDVFITQTKTDTTKDVKDTFMGSGPMDIDFKVDIKFMPDDDLQLFSGSETLVSDNSRQEVSHSEHTAFTEFKSLSGHLDHVCKETNIQDMHSQLQEVKALLEAAVIIDDHAEGEKSKKNAENATIQGIILIMKKILLLMYLKRLLNYDELDKEILSKKCKIMTPIPEFPTPTPLYSIPPETTPPIDTSKGKGVATEETNTKQIAYMEERGSSLKMPKTKSFITPEGTMSQEEFTKKIIEMKMFHDLKEQEKKSEEELKKLLNPKTFKAQALKWEEHEKKKSKMLNEFTTCISKRKSPLPIIRISYAINSRKEPTMRITRDNDPFNLITGKSYDALLQSLKVKFQWVLNQAKNLGLPPPPELVTFGLTAEDMKKKRSVIIKEVFLTINVKIEGIHKNLIPPSGIMPIQGLVINEPESGIFFMNGNTNIDFQRERKFHLTPTIELIRLLRQMKVDSQIAKEMFSRMNFVIESRDDCIKAKEAIEKNLDNMG